METYPIYWPQFYTATILEWKPLLKPAKYKDVIVQSLQHLTATKKITLYAFVIMDNHLHMIWQAIADKTPRQVQHSFMKFTAQQIKFDLVENHTLVLDKFRVNAKDRTYQFWERTLWVLNCTRLMYSCRSWSTFTVIRVKAGLCSLPEEYYYSSAKFYHTGMDAFNMLTHC